MLTHVLQFSTTEVEKLATQVREVDELRVKGKFLGDKGEVLEGNDDTCELLDKCLMWSQIVLERYVLT